MVLLQMRQTSVACIAVRPLHVHVHVCIYASNTSLINHLQHVDPIQYPKGQYSNYLTKNLTIN